MTDRPTQSDLTTRDPARSPGGSPVTATPPGTRPHATLCAIRVAGRQGWVYAMAMMKTTAEQVRTGHVITTDYGHPHTLEIAYVVRDTFVNAEGRRLDRFRFSGRDEYGTWREAWMGVGRGDRVYVLDDARGRGAFGALP